jgi:hypothetical protein
MSISSRAILHPAESAAILLLTRRIVGDTAIAEPLGRLPGRVARAFRNRAWRDILAHVAPELIPQAGIRIGHAAAMLGIVRPHAAAMRATKIPAVEIVLVNERIIHNHPAVAPSGMPSPSSPSAPAASEE